MTKRARPPRIKQKAPEKRATPAEIRTYIETARTYLNFGRPRTEVYRKLLEEHGIDEAQADRVCSEALAEMRAFFKLPLEDHKAMQLDRLMSLRAKAESKGKLNDALKAEAQIAMLKGTNAPTHVKVDIPAGEKERLVDVLVLLPDTAIDQILTGNQRVPLGHSSGVSLPSTDRDDDAEG